MYRSRVGSLLAGATLLIPPAAAARAQSVRLQLSPREGDTLRVRMEQESELVGIRKTANGETQTTVSTLLQVFSHAIVEGTTPTGAVVLTVTDSALLSTTDPSLGAARGKPIRIPVHREVRMRVAPSGTMELADSDPDRHEDSELASLMPAAFPTGRVRVGDRWTREMALPSVLGNAPAGVLRATFRFDSLGRGGSLAYVSMKGEVRKGGESDSGPGSPRLDGGRVEGMMVLDRKRGWLSESRFSIEAGTTLSSPGSLGSAPMHFRMRVTQRVKTLDRP